MNRNYWPSSSRPTHLPRLIQCERYFCAITSGRSIPSLRFVYRAIFLFIRATIIISRIFLFFFVAAGHLPSFADVRRETAGVRFDEIPLRDTTRAEESGRAAGLKQTLPAQSPSRPRTMHVAPRIIYTYRARCPAHTPAALSFRNPRDNAEQQPASQRDA